MPKHLLVLWKIKLVWILCLFFHLLYFFSFFFFKHVFLTEVCQHRSIAGKSFVKCVLDANEAGLMWKKSESLGGATDGVHDKDFVWKLTGRVVQQTGLMALNISIEWLIILAYFHLEKQTALNNFVFIQKCSHIYIKAVVLNGWPGPTAKHPQTMPPCYSLRFILALMYLCQNLPLFCSPNK